MMLGGRERSRPELQVASAEDRYERVHNHWIELRPGALDDDVASVVGGHRLAVRTVARQRIVDVGHRNDARLQRNRLSLCLVVSGAVEFIVMREDDRND